MCSKTTKGKKKNAAMKSRAIFFPPYVQDPPQEIIFPTFNNDNINAAMLSQEIDPRCEDASRER